MKIVLTAAASAAVLLAACGGQSVNSDVNSTAPGNTRPANGAATPGAGATRTNGETLKLAPGNTTLTFSVSRKNDDPQAGFTMFDGTFELVNGAPEESNFTIEAVTDTLFSDDPNLTEQLRSPAFLNASQFPKATFKSTQIAAGAKAPDNYTVTGDLTIRGQTKPVSFPARIAVTDNNFTMQGGFRGSRKDFGIGDAASGDNALRDDFSIMLDVNVSRRK